MYLTELVPIPFSNGKSTHYSNSFLDSSVTIPICFKDVNVNNVFLHTARLWNYLLEMLFFCTYNLNGSISRVKRHLSIIIRCLINNFYWMLHVKWTASYEITLLHLSICLSVHQSITKFSQDWIIGFF